MTVHKGTKQEAARRKLLSILPKQTIEDMLPLDEIPIYGRQPQKSSLYELLAIAVNHWDEMRVRMAIDRVFMRARGEQEPEQTTKGSNRKGVRKQRANRQHQLLSAARRGAK